MSVVEVSAGSEEGKAEVVVVSVVVVIGSSEETSAIEVSEKKFVK